jgi:isoquinoline 1-oxidoreductase beta subunit
MSIFTITRRHFLRQAGVGTGALVFGCYVSPKGLLAEEGCPPEGDCHKAPPPSLDNAALNNFVCIKPIAGTITIMSFRSEMGQGIRSSLAAVLADELEADWSHVVVSQADADGPRFAVPNPYYPDGKLCQQDPDCSSPDLPKYVIADEFSQFTDSSRSMALYYTAMRLFGAGIRLTLQRAAARLFKNDPRDWEARQHRVLHQGGRLSLGYGHPLLLLEAGKIKMEGKLPSKRETEDALKKSDKWRFIGKAMPFVDARDMVTGKAVYGADADPGRPGMLTAMIVRCPVANGRVVPFDKDAVLAAVRATVPDVVDICQVPPPDFPLVGGVGNNFMPLAGVAVLAKNTWVAWQGRRALKNMIKWDLEHDHLAVANAAYDSAAFRRKLEQSTLDPGKTVRSHGEVEAALAAADPVRADYYVPHQAQAPMEPPVAVALYENGRWEIWAPTQGPELLQHYVGLAMLRPRPDQQLEWLAWQWTELSEFWPDKEAEKDLQKKFNEQLQGVLKLDEAALRKLKNELKVEIRDKIKVHVTLLGGGFGRKSKPDFAIEAAFLARSHPGVPIRVQWSREDDIQFSYYNAASHVRLEAAVDGDGKATALLERSAFTSFFASIFPPRNPGWREKVNDLWEAARAAYHNGGKYLYGSGIEHAQGLQDIPFALENLRIDNCPAENHIRVGWMRSVANIYHAFAICSFADELAVKAGSDSKEYLLDLIAKEGKGNDRKGQVFDLNFLKQQNFESFDNNGFPVEPRWAASIIPGGDPGLIVPSYAPDTGRLLRVVNRVAEIAGWDDKVKEYKALKGRPGPGRGLGIAAHRSFLSYAAMVFDVSLGEPKGDGKLPELTINGVYAVIDCGLAVNPDRVRAQMEGGIVYGLSLALLGEITVKNGAVEQNNFDDYPVLRMYQTPKKISIDIMPPSGRPEDAVPTGVGEVPVPPVAPALANAIFAAGGLRIREIPFFRFVHVA